MYEAVTSAIRVRVTPRFLDEQSTPDESRYFWAYTVVIVNEGTETVQLKTRRWLITDANGRQETVRGPGVVGKTPTLAPGQRFEYTSGCPLTTPSGIMSGSYQMQRADGRMIDVAIPSFSLDSPYARRSIN
ncbi:MAG: Co2+/Mg2+ efflux protein ApaG [Hyphomicrobiaceae bacterium]